MRLTLTLPLTFTAVLCAGCATTESLPRSAAEVKLDPGRFEQGYWPRYRATTTLKAVSMEQALAAGRTALLKNDFKIVKDDPQGQLLMGEHTATLFYWNVMAGIYFVPSESGIEVKIVSVGSKDIGFIELAANPWPAKILASLQAALAIGRQ